MTAQKAVMFWLGGVFAGLWALINGLVYLFYKRNGFANPYMAKPAAP